MTTPPIAPQRPHTHTELGVPRQDPYHWLKDREDPATIAYLEAENAHTTSAMAQRQKLRASGGMSTSGAARPTMTLPAQNSTPRTSSA